MKNLILIVVILTGCTMPPIHHAIPDAGMESPDSGPLPVCENVHFTYFCAHDVTCCGVPCNSDYTCPVDQVTPDLYCTCIAMICPRNTTATECSTFTIDRHTTCPCRPYDAL